MPSARKVQKKSLGASRHLTEPAQPTSHLDAMVIAMG